MCHGQARLLLLSFSLFSPLSLWGFFSLLDGAEAEPQTNFSHSRNEAWRAQFVSLRGNRIHSSVPQKTPFFQTREGAFCLVTIAIELLQFMWLIQILSPTLRFWAMMACCAHYRRATPPRVAMPVTNNQIVHRVPFNEASKWFQIICVIV